jgi:hypothetical protein
MVSPEESIRKQFQKIGKDDAFTPELAEQIRKGVPIIEHKHPYKDRNGNEGNTTFHIKKSDRNNYFLNKFDMEVKWASNGKIVKDTFYYNDVRRNANNEKMDKEKFFTLYTFKKAFNYLLGRPVLNVYENLKNQSKKVWDLIDLKKPLGNDRYERRQFHENYGFDLGKVINNYSINPTFKDSLMQSLERGNLQSTKMIGNDGKSTPVDVSPNILLGSLNVFRFNEKTNKKELVQLSEVEKNGWITKEAAEKIRERISEMAKKNVQSSKQPSTESHGKTQKEKPAKEEKEGERQTKTKTVKEKTGTTERKTKKHTVRNS